MALELPDDVRAEVERWARREAGAIAELRLLAPEAIHVTLCFLGWLDEELVEPVGAAVAECAAPVPALALGAPAWLPPRGPRVLAVDVEDGEGALAELQRRVAAALGRVAGYEPERRPYRPHVSVARTRRGARLRGHELAGPRPLRFAGAALTLYRSRLAASGARYEPLARTLLERVSGLAD